MSPRFFHWALTGLLVALNFGSHIDARFHISEGFRIHSFLTPSHWGVIAAYGSIVLLIAAYAITGVRRGRPWREWLPTGHNWSAAGAALWAVGLPFDLYWHETFGFEIDLETVITPSHTVLFVGTTLIAIGILKHSLLLRRAATPERSDSIVEQLPLAIAIAAILRSVLWLTWYSDPLTADYAAGGAINGDLAIWQRVDLRSGTGEVAGTAGALLNTLILVPFFVLPLWHWRLPVGSVAVIFGYVWMLRFYSLDRYALVPVVLLTIVVAEATWAWIRSGGERRLSDPVAYRALAVAAILTFYVAYFALLQLATSGILWPIHLWTGVIVISALLALLLSYALTQDRSVSASRRPPGQAS